MSPQSRATSNNTTFPSRDDVDYSGNICPGASSVAEIARAANMEYALHKIESESSSATPANPLANQATSCANASQLLRKRASACITSPSPKNQPFLSSYGSAFLSGIFADIAVAEDDEPPIGAAVSQVADPASTAHEDPVSNEPCHKKARTTTSTSFGRQPKSYKGLSGLFEGAVSEVSSPSVVSPRPNTSTQHFHLFNDQVRELQDMAFPSLPQIPITVSSSSCSTASHQAVVTPRDVTEDVQDGSSYGWFVSIDGDEAEDQKEPSASMFLPDTKPDLAFKAITAPNGGNQDLEVQQALAADTIDDVLGDLF